ncbi:transcriptional regulator [Agrobacterium tumefaciens]|uniref:Transcriptional regulator n=1 Tax=Agrobacterium tumefaciens TaxID=358 RepID=A0A0D0JHR3_AGRTU|nr:transcriptional regulator [Agrobacterium tumefaciens]
MINLKSDDNDEITGAQIRAARGLLRWSAKELAMAASIGVATISRAEVQDGRPPLTSANLKAIRKAFEDRGIEFIPTNGGGVGVRFKNP